MKKLQVQIDMPLGKGMVKISLPQQNLADLVTPAYYAPVKNRKKAIRDAIKQPIGNKSLVNTVSRGDTVAIVIDDLTRPTPTQEILEVLIEELTALGVERADITILIATGMHRPLEKGEIQELIGSDLSTYMKVINHTPREEKNLVYLGESKHGTPIWINKIFYQAKIKILTGYIAPHEIFGFTGGRKSIVPGLAGEKTIRANHHFKWQSYNPCCDSFVLNGNPCHEDAMDILDRTNVNFLINVVLNHQDELIKVVAGEPAEAWYEGAKYVQQIYETIVKEPVDMIITSPGGFPYDLDFYQVIDTMLVSKKNPVFKPGATILFLAECSEGIGNSDMWELFVKSRDLYEVKALAESQEGNPGVYAAHVFAHHVLKYNLQILGYTPVIPNSQLEKMFITPVKNLDEAIQNCLVKHGPGTRILVVPYSKKTVVRPINSWQKILHR